MLIKKFVHLKQMKKFALTNNLGFTMLEAIVGMLVLSVIIFLLMSLILVMNKNNINNYFNRNTATINQMMATDVDASNKLEIKLGMIILKPLNQDKKVTYQCQGKKLVRRVNGLGGETLISNLDRCHVREEGSGALLILKMGTLEKEIYVQAAKV